MRTPVYVRLPAMLTLVEKILLRQWKTWKSPYSTSLSLIKTHVSILPLLAFKDPKIEGVTIYLADFERPINEKLQKNFFEDPTSTSLSCARDTTIKVGDINKEPQGEVDQYFYH